jgi:hypothetical protein
MTTTRAIILALASLRENPWRTVGELLVVFMFPVAVIIALVVL